MFELGRAERRWAARPFQDYSFEYQVSCGLCSRFFVEWTRVSVANGHVVGVVYVASDSALPQEQWAYFPTVDTLFAWIRSASHEDGMKDVKVEYDPALGYPTLIETISDPYIPDAGHGESVRNLVAIPDTARTVVPTP